MKKSILKVCVFSLLIGAGFWLASTVLISMAQTRDEQRSLDLRDQVERNRQNIENLQANGSQFALSLEARLVRLETKMDGIEKLLWGVSGALLALIVETFWSHVLYRKRPGKETLE